MSGFADRLGQQVLDWKIATQKLDDAISDAMKAADAIIATIETKGPGESEGEPRNKDELWRWASKRGITEHDWKGVAVGLRLKSTKNLSGEQFEQLKRGITNMVRRRQGEQV